MTIEPDFSPTFIFAEFHFSKSKCTEFIKIFYLEHYHHNFLNEKNINFQASFD